MIASLPLPNYDTALGVLGIVMLATVVGTTWELLDRGDGRGDMTEQVAANAIYVATTGSDTTGDGSEGSPYASLEHAAPLATAGQTIYLRGGTYANNDADPAIAYLTTSTAGASGNPIIISSYPGETAILEDNTADYGIRSDGAKYVRVKNLIIKNVVDSCIDLSSDTSSGNEATYIPSEEWEVIGNQLLDCGVPTQSCSDQGGHNGITSDRFTDTTLVDGNIIDNAGRTRDLSCDALPQADNHQYRHDHAIYLQGKYHTITNNTITNYKAGFGVKFDGHARVRFGVLPADEFTHVVVNNTFGPLTNPSIYESEGGVAFTFFNNDPSENEYARAIIANNIFLDQSPATTPIRYQNSSFATGSIGNLCYNNQAEDYTEFLSVCATSNAWVTDTEILASGNQDGIALSAFNFANAPALNYRIGAGSVSDGFGANDQYTPPIDQDGNGRPNPPSAGAFEGMN